MKNDGKPVRFETSTKIVLTMNSLNITTKIMNV